VLRQSRPALRALRLPFVQLILFYLVYWGIVGAPMEDFDWLRAGGRAVLHGVSPYSPPDPQLLARNDRFVYPAVDAYVFAPFAALPHAVAVELFLLLSCLAVAGGLWLLGVRDRRCVTAALASAPVFISFAAGTLGPLLFLGAAAAWRYRDRTLVSAVVVGLTASAKVFLWPLVIWLVATRRWRAAVGAVGVGVVVNLVAWAAIGFDGLRDYPKTLRVLNEVQRWKSYSFSGLASALGLPATVGTVAIAAAAVVGSLLVFRLARTSGDASAFAASILTALFATPLLWNHYLVLLLAPLALAFPRLSPAWVLMLLLWASPHPEAAGVVWRSVFLLAFTAVIGIASLTRLDGRRLVRERSFERLRQLSPVRVRGA
jgi:hypothetical protein